MRARVWVPAAASLVLLPVGWWLAIRVDALDQSGRFTAVLTAIVVALSVTALLAERRRPGRAVAPVIATLAVLVLVSAFRALPSPWWAAIGALVWLAGPLVIVDLLIAYPDGLSGRARRRATVAFWVVPTAFAVAIVAVSGPAHTGGSTVRAATWNLGFQQVTVRLRNPLLLHESALLVKLFSAGWMVWVLASLAGAAVVLARRWRRADRPTRRLLGPITASGLLAAVGVGVQVAATWPERDPFAPDAALNVGAWYTNLLSVSALVALPVLTGVLVWLEIFRPQLARNAGGTLRLPAEDEPGGNEAALRRSLGDPTLLVAFRADQGWVDARGDDLSFEDRPDRATTAIVQDGRPIAALDHDIGLLDRPDELDSAARVVAMTLDTARLRALTLAQAETVRASGARLLEATDQARRRFEAQIDAGPRTLIAAAAAELVALDGGEQAAALHRAADLIVRAQQQVRAISHGLAPPTLDQLGLHAALEDVLDRAEVEVSVTATLDRRLPRAIETSLYVAASEAVLTATGPVELAFALGDGHVTADLRGGLLPATAIVRDRLSALGGTIIERDGRTEISVPISEPPPH